MTEGRKRWRLFIVVPIEGAEVYIRSFWPTKVELLRRLKVAEALVKSGRLARAEAWDWTHRTRLPSRARIN